jgi:hypothetical protein
LRSLEQGSCLPTYEVVLKAVKPITGVSLHLTTTDLAYQAHWIGAIGAMVKRYGVKPIDHLLVLHAESGETILTTRSPRSSFQSRKWHEREAGWELEG